MFFNILFRSNYCSSIILKVFFYSQFIIIAYICISYCVSLFIHVSVLLLAYFTFCALKLFLQHLFSSSLILSSLGFWLGTWNQLVSIFVFYIVLILIFIILLLSFLLLLCLCALL